MASSLNATCGKASSMSARLVHSGMNCSVVSCPDPRTDGNVPLHQLLQSLWMMPIQEPDLATTSCDEARTVELLPDPTGHVDLW